MGDSSLPTVLVTGFGPFRNHVKNASWITVRELPKLKRADYNVVIREIPVAYDAVTEFVPLLWREIKPKLTVHCGMCEMRTCLSIEKIARRKGYLHCDINGKFPLCHECCSDGPDVLCTSIDLKKVINDVSGIPICARTETSEDAGLYLCEFIYYTSLNINRNTVFVHVPPIDEPYSADKMALTLSAIISSILKQLES